MFKHPDVLEERAHRSHRFLAVPWFDLDCEKKEKKINYSSERKAEEKDSFSKSDLRGRTGANWTLPRTISPLANTLLWGLKR